MKEWGPACYPAQVRPGENVIAVLESGRRPIRKITPTIKAAFVFQTPPSGRELPTNGLINADRTTGKALVLLSFRGAKRAARNIDS
jgi:hypothetical protein